MVSLKVTSVKTFMSHLLLSDTFDQFQFIEGEIVTFNTFKIDGFLQKSFFSEQDNLETYSSWSSIRDYCFRLIRGKRPPLSFKFIFRLSPEQIQSLLSTHNLDFLPDQIQGCYLNIHYDGVTLRCTTGTSLNIFILDKSLEQVWDQTALKFFIKKEIPFDV